jgi:HPt (histidine-containing phosphotransfer) domain-containing protein
MAGDGAVPLLNREILDEIKRLEEATGKHDLLASFVRMLEGNLAGFGTTFSDCVARGDPSSALRAAHTLKGASRQLGAQALGELFAEIERSAKAGDYAEARRKFDDGAALIARSVEALKQA